MDLSSQSQAADLAAQFIPGQLFHQPSIKASHVHSPGSPSSAVNMGDGAHGGGDSSLRAETREVTAREKLEMSQRSAGSR